MAYTTLMTKTTEEIGNCQALADAAFIIEAAKAEESASNRQQSTTQQETISLIPATSKFAIPQSAIHNPESAIHNPQSTIKKGLHPESHVPL
jgi:hypothetical protein